MVLLFCPSGLIVLPLPPSLSCAVVLVPAMSSFASQFLVTTFREQRRLFDDPISELRIGIFSDSVVTVHEHACLSEVLDLLEQHRKYRAFVQMLFSTKSAVLTAARVSCTPGVV